MGFALSSAPLSYAHPRSSGRRVAAIVVTIALHVALLYALMHGLARKTINVVAPPLV